MEITWLGHNAVRIKSGQSVLVMDPYTDASGLKLPPQLAQANVVTVSGADPDFSAVANITGDQPPTVINGPGEYEASSFRIKGIRTPAYAEGGEIAWNTVYAIELEGMILSHLGNPGRLLTNREIEELGSPHVLLLAIGSKNGLSGEDTVEMVNAIGPKIVIPVLYAHAGNKADLRELAPFLKELGATPEATQNRTTITRATLPEETTVVVLAPANVLI
ncbi:MAG: MBL fold metallo-hydrolase [Chloroflexi bacterium]|nr:MBL fold metallo-hydrolase [Chloroflexota bacterium]